jgi:RNA polymerase sigma-70 factor (ECF subfamily)
VTLPADALPDETLASQAQQGDRQAFEALVGRHKDALYRLMRRYLGNADDAYDLLQDTLISVWENFARYDPKRSFFSWTRTIALNKCRDFSRRQRFRTWFSQILSNEPNSEPLSPVDHAERDEAQMQQEQRLRRLDAAVAALRSFYKEPLLLTAVDGLSQEATAALLGTTTKAIEMRLRRARRALTQALNRPYGG